MSKRIIITGINGFVGEHLARLFREKDFLVMGVGYDAVPNSKVAILLDTYVCCNLLDKESLKQIDTSDSCAVIHLAGLSAVGKSFEQPRNYITGNPIMTYNLLDHLQSKKFKGRSVIVSTGSVYNPKAGLPIKEISPTKVTSPYVIGKLSTEEVTRYFINRGNNAVIVRPFNHIGPGQSTGFIVPDLHVQLQQARHKKTITVGNLNTKRDYTDVRDIVRAYELLALAKNLQHDTYNICSGRSISGNQILKSLQQIMNIHDIQIAVDETKLRSTDIMDIYGDSSRLRDELGWEPLTPIEKTLEDFVKSKEE